MEKQNTTGTARGFMGLKDRYIIILDTCDVYKNNNDSWCFTRNFWNRAYREATNHEIIVAKLKGKLYE